MDCLEEVAGPCSQLFFSILFYYYFIGNFKVRKGRRAANFSKLWVLIAQPFLIIYRHAIHQIKAEYHRYLLVSVILYDSSEVKLKIVKEHEN